MSSVVRVASLPVEGTFASGSRPGGGRMTNRRAASLYNSNNLTRGDRISLDAAMRRGESLAAWRRRRGV